MNIEEIKKSIMDEYQNFKMRYDEHPDYFVLGKDHWSKIVKEANDVIARYGEITEGDANGIKSDSVIKFNGIKLCSLPVARGKVDPFGDVVAHIDPETRMDWLLWVVGCYLEDDRPPFSHEFLSQNCVTSDEVFTLSARCAIILKSYVVSSEEERKRVLIRGLLSDMDNVYLAHVFAHMDMDRILRKLEEM